MDLGIRGRRAILVASSRGLGFACAEALAAEGVHLTLNGRDPNALAESAASIRDRFDVEVHEVVGDSTDQSTRDALVAETPEADILVTNNGGPRPGAYDEIDEADFARALELHYWTPIGLLRAVAPGMAERGFGRIVNLTSAMVCGPRTVMAASSGARTGMTAVMKGASRKLAPHNVTVNQILPERIDSGRQMQMAHIEAETDGVSFEEARRRQAESIAAKRLGRPEEVGAACAFLCGVNAGYISGVNLRLDGGSYDGLI